jgi:hypothetical protein
MTSDTPPRSRALLGVVWAGLAVAAAGWLAIDRRFALQAERVRVAGVPVPDALVDRVIGNFDPTPRIAGRLPFPVQIGRVSVGDEAPRISRER